MSTRGVIARWQGDGSEGPSFEGRYHHWDSYPDGLGKALFGLAREIGVERMLEILIDEHPAGWSTIVDADFGLEPGFIEDPNIPVKDHRPRCYCHGDRAEELWLLTEADASRCGCEWVYAFEDHQMHILASFNGNGSKMIGIAGSGNPDATWKEVALVNLDGPEPDWKQMDPVA